MSRESFDSYRRSFDISARSPIPCFNDSDSILATRRSIDSSKLSAHERRRADWPEDHVPEDDEEEADFEDIRLAEDANAVVTIKVITAENVMPAKKKGLFSRFGGESEHNGSGFFSSSKKRQSDTDMKSVPDPESPPPQQPKETMEN
jgi:hypothetical protein